MVALALLALLLAPGEAQATHESICLQHDEEPGKLVEPIELCGVTTITADDPAVVRVRIPQDVRVANPWFDSSDIEVAGAGRFVGFALAQEALVANRDVYIGGRLPESADSRMFLEKVHFLQSTSPETAAFSIEAGRYLLYLLPDDGPATLSLRLSELKGEVSYQARTATGYQLSFPEPELSTPLPSSELLYSSRAHGSLRSHGLVYQAAWFHTSAHAAASFDSCMFRGTLARDPADPATYGPGCAWWSAFSPVQRDNGQYGAVGSVGPRMSLEPAFNLFYGGEHTSSINGPDPEPEGPYTAQLSVGTASLDASIESLALFLSFE